MIKTKSSTRLGYPSNHTPYWVKDIERFCTVKHYGVGDPFHENQKFLMPVASCEKEVVLFYADLWNLSEEETWGYITSSSSESLMFAMWCAKRAFKRPPNKAKGIIIYSQDVHYTTPNSAEMLSIPSFYDLAIKKNIPVPDGWTEWPNGVPTHPVERTMDLDALKTIVDTFAGLGYALLVFFTCGTTIGQAVDNVRDGA
jgi:hypothetical protein